MKHLSRITPKLPELTAILAAMICSSSAYAADASRINASDVNTEGCKAYVAERPAKLVGSDNETPLWRVRYDKGTLSVTWLNFTANCCTEGFNSWINTPEDGVLDINLFDKDGMCDCLCPYDVDASFPDIAEGLYTLRFHTQDFEDVTVQAYLNEGFDWVFNMPDPAEKDRIYASDQNVSGCKGRSMAPQADRKNAPSLEPLAWNIRYNGSTLDLTWENLNGNCMTQGFDNWMVATDASTIDFYINEIFVPGVDMATCVCPYDVSASFSDIKPGKYTFNLHYYADVKSVNVTLADGMDVNYLSTELTGVTAVEAAGKSMKIANGDVLQCLAEGSFTVEIIGTDGLTPLRLKSDGPTEISLSTLPAGVYIARLLYPDGRVDTLRFTR